jgi:hypothetical protein
MAACSDGFRVRPSSAGTDPFGGNKVTLQQILDSKLVEFSLREC